MNYELGIMNGGEVGERGQFNAAELIKYINIKCEKYKHYLTTDLLYNINKLSYSFCFYNS